MNVRGRFNAAAITWLFVAGCGGDNKKAEFPEPIATDAPPEGSSGAAEAPAPETPAPEAPGSEALKAGPTGGVSAVSADGGITESDVSSAVAAVSGKTNACEETYLKKNPQGAGQLSVTAAVGKKGKAKKVTVKPGDIKDKGFARCLTAAFRSVTWPTPTAKKATVSFTWTVTTKS